SNMRVRRMSVSDGVLTLKVSLFAALLTGMFRLLRLKFLEVGVEPVETSFPDLPVPLGPLGHFLERRGLEGTGAGLCLAPARNEARSLEHPQVFGDRGHGHLKRGGELGYGAFPGREPGENRAPRWVGEGRERRSESVGGHLHLTTW